MPIFTTSQNRPVEHCHLGRPPHCEVAELTQDRIDRIRRIIRREHPQAVEVAAPTNTYNCIGYAFADSHGIFLEQDPFLIDDYVEASFDNAAENDVVIYRTGSGAFAHVAVVTSVGGGRITKLRSKWGRMSELLHTIDDVDSSYGRAASLHRPRPGFQPFARLPADEELPALTGSASFAVSGSEKEMPEFESTEEAIRWALGRILDPDVNIRV